MSIISILESRNYIMPVREMSVRDAARAKIQALRRKIDYKRGGGGVKTAMYNTPHQNTSTGRGLAKAGAAGAAGILGAYAAYKGAKLVARGVKKVYNKIRGREAMSQKEMFARAGSAIKSAAHKVKAALTRDDLHKVKKGVRLGIANTFGRAAARTLNGSAGSVRI